MTWYCQPWSTVLHRQCILPAMPTCVKMQRYWIWIFEDHHGMWRTGVSRSGRMETAHRHSRGWWPSGGVRHGSPAPQKDRNTGLSFDLESAASWCAVESLAIEIIHISLSPSVSFINTGKPYTTWKGSCFFEIIGGRMNPNLLPSPKRVCFDSFVNTEPATMTKWWPRPYSVTYVQKICCLEIRLRIDQLLSIQPAHVHRSPFARGWSCFFVFSWPGSAIPASAVDPSTPVKKQTSSKPLPSNSNLSLPSAPKQKTKAFIFSSFVRWPEINRINQEIIGIINEIYGDETALAIFSERPQKGFRQVMLKIGSILGLEYWGYFDKAEARFSEMEWIKAKTFKYEFDRRRHG